MDGKIIDLRKRKQEIRINNIPDQPPPGFFSWSALEYETRERGQKWFLTSGGIATLLIVIGILLRSYFFAIFVALAFGVILLYAKRTPRRIIFSVTEEGIHAGRRYLPFNSFKSFWIFERPGRLPELSLRTESFFIPFMVLPLGKTNPDRLKKILRRFLTEEKQKESNLDQLMRNLGF